jgi:hypothetical protein
LFVLCTAHQAPAFVCLDSVPIKHSTAQPRPAHLLTLFSLCAVTLLSLSLSLSLFLQPTQLNPHSVVVFNARLLKKGLHYCYCLTPAAPAFAIIIIPIVGCKAAAAAYVVQPSSCGGGGGGGGTGTSSYGSCMLLLLLQPSPVHWLLVEQLFCHLFFAVGVVVVVVVVLVVLLEAVVSVRVLVFVGGRRNSFGVSLLFGFSLQWELWVVGLYGLCLWLQHCIAGSPSAL